MVMMILVQGRKGDTVTENSFCTQWEEERVGQIERVALKNMCYHM